MQLKVTGIAEDVPANSHLDFDMIVPLSNWQKSEVGLINGPITACLFMCN